jgi:hypothetical protein
MTTNEEREAAARVRSAAAIAASRIEHKLGRPGGDAMTLALVGAAARALTGPLHAFVVEASVTCATLRTVLAETADVVALARANGLTVERTIALIEGE